MSFAAPPRGPHEGGMTLHRAIVLVPITVLALVVAACSSATTAPDSAQPDASDAASEESDGAPPSDGPARCECSFQEGATGGVFGCGLTRCSYESNTTVRCTNSEWVPEGPCSDD